MKSAALAAAMTLALAAVPLPACADEVTTWNTVALNAIRAERTPPPKAARALAMLHASVYDAVNAVVPTHKPYMFRGSPSDAVASQVAAAAQAAHDVLAAVFPGQSESFDAQLAASLASVLEKTRSFPSHNTRIAAFSRRITES